MSRRADGERLKDIQEAIQRSESYAAGMSYEDFLDDSKTQDAVLRNTEIMGEAANVLSDSGARNPATHTLAQHCRQIVSSMITSASTWTSSGR